MAAGTFGSRTSEPWAEFQRLDASVTQLREEVQRVHDEVEACSVLVLSLDSTAAVVGTASMNTAGGGNGATESMQAEASRLAAKILVLETKMENREAIVARGVEDSMQRLDKEIMDLWRQVRVQEDAHLPAFRDLTRDYQKGLQDLKMQVTAVREEVLRGGGGGALDAAGLDDLVHRVSSELGRTVEDFERRLCRVEQGVAQQEAHAVAQQANDRKTEEVYRMIELLVQEKRKDVFATNEQFRKVDVQLKEFRDKDERDRTWNVEADEIRGEIEDLKITKIPAIAAQSSRASTLIAEGLQALRKEVWVLRERPEKVQNSLEDAAALESEIVTVRAEIEEIRRQVSKALMGGFEDRMLGLRADFAAEVESAVREVRESWADTSRRLAALEPWQRESAQVHAELRQLKIERQEDRSRFDTNMKHELAIQRAATTEALETRLAGFRHDISVNPTKALRAFAPDTPGGGDIAITGSARAAGAGGAPVVLGRRIEWALSSNALLAARRPRAGRKPEPVVTGELEVAGIRCRLKFYPDGSPLRTVEGYCSLYLLSLNPVAVRFHLFAGSHVSPLLECNYDRRRDQGRHDLCGLEEVLDDDGGIVIGAEISDVTALLASSE